MESICAELSRHNRGKTRWWLSCVEDRSIVDLSSVGAFPCDIVGIGI